MDNFDLRKYLAEGRLLKEDIKGMVDTDLALGGYLRMVEPNPEDYGVEQEEIDDIKKILSVPKMTWPDFMEVYNAFIAEHVDGSSDEILDIIDSHNLSEEEKEEVLSMYGGETIRIYKENKLVKEDKYTEIVDDGENQYLDFNYGAIESIMGKYGKTNDDLEDWLDRRSTDIQPTDEEVEEWLNSQDLEIDLKKYLHVPTTENKLLKEDLLDQIKQIQDYEKTEDSLDYNGYFVQKYIDGGETIYVVWEDRGENVDSDPQPDFESTNPNAIKDFLTKNNPVKEEIGSSELLGFIHNNWEEVAAQVGNTITDIGIDEEGDVGARDVDGFGGFAFRDPEDVDDEFVGEDGDSPRPIEVAGRKLLYIAYNI